jgi:pimeloyl-ACP methyl ester carboxylesterase
MSASLQSLLRGAIDAYRTLETDDGTQSGAAAAATRAIDDLLERVLRQNPDGWSEGRLRLEDVDLQVEFRAASSQLRPPLRIKRARDVSMDAFAGRRYARPGFGVPVAALSSRHGTASLDRLAPHCGALRNFTAWIEPGAAADAPPRLVFADPIKLDAVTIGPHRLTLASDSSAAYAWCMEISKLERLGFWGLLGGKKIGRRAGLYMLEDFDPDKRPLVMIHGLASNPLIWSHLSNAVWGDDSIRAKFQVWQVVYQTDAPVLGARLHIQQHLDDAWRLLDPNGDARARAGAVLVGHSMGGVIARLLCAESGDVPWNAVFLVPPDALDASEGDLEVIKRVFYFHPYPGVSRAIFLAAPHRGSPEAATMLGRVTSDFVGRRSIEVQALRRIAIANPGAIRPQMREIIQAGWINSITTLQSEQPVRRAVESLSPPPGFPYHTIAGAQPGRETDGVVPLDSACIPGAASTLVLESGHGVYENPRAVAEVLRILGHLSA